MKPTTSSAVNQAVPLQLSPRQPQKAPVFNKDGQTLLTYNMDLFQTSQVGSTEPQSLCKLDRMKKRLDEDRGYQSDGGKVSVSHTRSQAVKTGASPTLPPRVPRGSHPPRGPSMQRVSPSPQSSPVPAHLSPTSSTTVSNETPKKILFYHAHDPYYGFTNFSPDPVQYNGKTYPTSEHLFQSMKFMKSRSELAEHIRTCSTRPRVVFDEAHRFNPEVRTDWLQVRIEMMELVLWHKFTQNNHLKKELLSTGEAELVEDSDKDSFWGVGADRKGQNQLGKALVRLRTKLRDEQSAGSKILKKTIGR